MNGEFYSEVEKQRKVNEAKWGCQDVAKLLLVCQEQLGQMTSAYLNRGQYDGEFKKEIIHLAAVLPTIDAQTM